jgi:TRAP-type mannitol/chloroaromatic compound transport system substrate-binding protein
MKLDLNRRRILSTGVAAAVIGLVGAVPTQAAETIKLTAMDGYPAKAMWVKEFINYFIPEVDKALAAKGNYKIEWQQAWGGTIVKKKGVLEGLKLGLGDIGVVTTVFHNDKLPLQAIAYVTPFVTVNPKLVAQTVDGLIGRRSRPKIRCI